MATTDINNNNAFHYLPDDVVLNILCKLNDDPRHLARLACVSAKFASLIRHVCFRDKCLSIIPALVSDLLSSSSSSSTPDGGWAALHKLAVCCPGLLHSGVLLENSDFGLERELGPDSHFPLQITEPEPGSGPEAESEPNCTWSLYDDLYMDTVYDSSEVRDEAEADVDNERKDDLEETVLINNKEEEQEQEGSNVIRPGCNEAGSSRTRVCRSLRAHLASGVWNLSREQGNKLLASRFRGDCLYICDWPGCVHIEEKRSYMLFRGVFKDFKRSRVWRTINDGNCRSKVSLSCAFCACNETWDLHASFCLRRVYGFHDDGEPVVRAYVCENGHVSGAWTDWPLYT